MPEARAADSTQAAPEGARLAAPRRGPGALSQICSHCQSPVDPLRAARVALFGDRFHYFCSRECRASYQPAPAEPPAQSSDGPLSGPRERAAEASTPSPDRLPGERSSGHSGASSRLPMAAFAASAVGAALSVVATLDLAPTWCALAAVAAACGLTLRSWQRDPFGDDRTHLLLGTAGPVVASASAALALALDHPWAASATLSASACCALSSATRWLAFDALLQTAGRITGIQAALNESVHGLGGERDRLGDGAVLKPGQELLLETGQRVPADSLVVAGEARVQPWLDSPLRVSRGVGDVVFAGARVVSGTLRVVVRWSSWDCAWARLTYAPDRRADRHTALSRLAHRIETRGAMAAGLCAAAYALATTEDGLLAASYAASAVAAVASAGLARLSAAHANDAVLCLLSRGVAMASPAAMDRAAGIGTAVFCARGTLQAGHPRLASIEPLEPTDSKRLLALAAGAYRGAASATGKSLTRAAREQGVTLDAARSQTHFPGLGAVAVSASGASIVVGSRSLLLEQRVSIAAFEARLEELERLGRSVSLVALDGHVIGILALQDVVVPSARSAVQELMDAGIEPVWLSSDSRTTCDVLARSVDIAHVRPEVDREAQAEEVNRLIRAGHRVAVIGRSPDDDLALSAAALSINVSERGGLLERWDVEIASHRLDDAALALSVAHAQKARIRRALMLAGVPGALGIALVLWGAPAWVPPVAALVGSTRAFRELASQLTAFRAVS